MSPTRETAPGFEPSAVAPSIETYPHCTDFRGRLARRDAQKLLQALRDELDRLDNGDVALDVAAAMMDILAGRLAVIALSGELVAA